MAFFYNGRPPNGGLAFFYNGRPPNGGPPNGGPLNGGPLNGGPLVGSRANPANHSKRSGRPVAQGEGPDRIRFKTLRGPS